MTPWPKALVIAAWIGSLWTGVLAVLMLWWSAGSGYWLAYMVVAWLALACLLLPPLWMKRSKTVAYARVATGFALMVVAMFTPIQTHAVKLDMPKPTAPTK